MMETENTSFECIIQKRDQQINGFWPSKWSKSPNICSKVYKNTKHLISFQLWHVQKRRNVKHWCWVTVLSCKSRFLEWKSLVFAFLWQIFVDWKQKLHLHFCTFDDNGTNWLCQVPTLLFGYADTFLSLGRVLVILVRSSGKEIS